VVLTAATVVHVAAPDKVVFALQTAPPAEEQKYPAAAAVQTAVLLETKAVIVALAQLTLIVAADEATVLSESAIKASTGVVEATMVWQKAIVAYVFWVTNANPVAHVEHETKTLELTVIAAAAHVAQFVIPNGVAATPVPPVTAHDIGTPETRKYPGEGTVHVMAAEAYVHVIQFAGHGEQTGDAAADVFKTYPTGLQAKANEAL